MLQTTATYCVIVLLTPLILVGTVGNFLSILTWSRGSHRETSTAALLTALAVFDTLVLWMPAVEFYAHVVFRYAIRTQNIFVCKLFPFVSYFAPTTSAWILGFVTVERAVSMVMPHKVRYLCTRPKVSLILIGMVTFCGIIYSPFLVKIELVHTNNTGNITVNCGMHRNETFFLEYFRKMIWMDCILLALIPFIIIVTGNTLILYKLFSGGKELNKTGHMVRNRIRAANAFTVRAIALSITFFICTTPVAVLEVYSITTLQENTHKVAHVLIHILLYGNSSLNFILYCAIGSEFRKELRRVLTQLIFGKKYHHSANPTINSLVHYSHNGRQNTTPLLVKNKSENSKLRPENKKYTRSHSVV